MGEFLSEERDVYSNSYVKVRACDRSVSLFEQFRFDLLKQHSSTATTLTTTTIILKGQ